MSDKPFREDSEREAIPACILIVILMAVAFFTG